MKSKIDFEECLRDSPKFRVRLDEEEQEIEHLEQKLDRIIKICTLSVDSGKEYVKNQSAFATSLWDLQKHFQDDKSSHSALGKLIHCLQEMNKFHTTLLDQASRTVLKNLSTFVKCDIKEVKDYKHLFIKVSENLDIALSKNAQANKNRTQEVIEAENYLSATKSCFRHTSLDYVNSLTMLQSKKKPEILSTMLSYIQACSTYYHQGSDLCEDFESFFKTLGDDVGTMRSDSNQLEKLMQNRHTYVNNFLEETISKKPLNRIEGYLFKKTSKGFKTWNRRWFFMSENQLVYRKRSGDELPTVMEEDLRLCTVRPVFDSDRRYCFEVISPSKSHILQADCEEMFQAWIFALQKEIGAAIQLHNDDDDSETTIRSGGSSNMNQSGQFISSSSSSSSNQNQSNRKINNVFRNWKEFLKIPGNSTCCDCGSLEPRWASINLGITLCIACSGVHRSLGVHYSKVRSLTLDAWEPEIVKVMSELGNNIVNSIYEANYNYENSTIQKATDNCDTNVRELWIKSKYVEKKFISTLTSLTQKLITKNFNDLSATTTNTIRTGTNPTRWSVKKSRRHSNNKLRQMNDAKVNDSQQSCAISEYKETSDDDDYSETESFKDATSGDLLVFGDDTQLNLLKDNVNTNNENNTIANSISNSTNNLVANNVQYIHSDQESTTGDEDALEDEDIAALNPNLLLYKASAAHNLPVMCQAMALGANKNYQNENDLNRTPLHQAVLSGSVMACEYLLVNGAIIDVCDIKNYTPLHLATEKGCTAQAYLLLKHKAKHDIVADNGKKPIDIAVDQANADIVTLLRLTRLNEEIGISEQGSLSDETYNDVMKDFSHLACSQPHRLQQRSNNNNNKTINNDTNDN